MEPQVFLTLLLVWAAVVAVQAREVDIRRMMNTIVDRHNNERRGSYIRAPYMMELHWDDGLARAAQEWSNRCEYRRPDRHGATWIPNHISVQKKMNIGSNVYYESHRPDLVKKFTVAEVVDHAFVQWTNRRSTFKGDRPCDSGNCDYAQLVNYDSDSIGCAITRCRSVRSGPNIWPNTAYLFVCLYTPGYQRHRLPNFEYPSCANCPYGTSCVNKLCRRPTYHRPSDYDRNDYGKNTNNRYDQTKYDPVPAPSAPSAIYYYGNLTRFECDNLLDAHNRVRLDNRLDPVVWDSYLESWAKYVIRCETNYPGPRHAFTNFARISNNEDPSIVVSDWVSEGYDTNLHFKYGCRTPLDSKRCNHNTVINEVSVTQMGCASMSCGYSRQLVCIYDNKVERSRDSRRAYYDYYRTGNRYNDRYRRRSDYYRRRNDYYRRRIHTRIRSL